MPRTDQRGTAQSMAMAPCYVLLNSDSTGAETQPARRFFEIPGDALSGIGTKQNVSFPSPGHPLGMPGRLVVVRPVSLSVRLLIASSRRIPIRALRRFWVPHREPRCPTGSRGEQRLPRLCPIAYARRSCRPGFTCPACFALLRKWAYRTLQSVSRIMAKSQVNCRIPCPVGMFTQTIHLLTTLSLSTRVVSKSRAFDPIIVIRQQLCKSTGRERPTCPSCVGVGFGLAP